MTNEEAIRNLDIMWKMLTSAYDDIADSYAVAYTMAVDALEKQIPKKGRITTSTKRCSVCGRQLSGIGNIHPARNYCQGCGQAIDWGAEEWQEKKQSACLKTPHGLERTKR